MDFNFRSRGDDVGDPDDACCDVLFQAIVNRCEGLVNELLLAGTDPSKYA